MRREPTALGRAIRRRLGEMGKTQMWLEEQVEARTGLFFDNSYLWKIIVGELATPRIVEAIREILDIPEEESEE